MEAISSLKAGVEVQRRRKAGIALRFVKPERCMLHMNITNLYQSELLVQIKK
jgi:hypothetical protein